MRGDASPRSNISSPGGGDFPAATGAAHAGFDDDVPIPGQPRGIFSHLNHYNKLYEALHSAYTANKITLRAQSQSRFAELVRVALEILAVVVEVEGSAFHKYAEEVLSYFQVRWLEREVRRPLFLTQAHTPLSHRRWWYPNRGQCCYACIS